MRTRFLPRFRPSLSIITATRARPAMLMRVCFSSLLSQTHKDLEWIVVNDGADRETRKLVTELSAPFEIRHFETTSPAPYPEGPPGNLCDARNLGLAQARGQWVTYLDDDNALEPEFVDTVLRFLRSSPHLRCALVQQRRHRDLSDTGAVVRRASLQIQPRAGSSIDSLLIAGHTQLDGNGLVHLRNEAPRWNPDYRVFADYEYCLRLLSRWGEQSFGLLEKVLVEYFQCPDGIVGRSTYANWEDELRMLWENRVHYPILGALRAESWLPVLIENLSVKAHLGAPIRGYGKAS